MRLLALAWIALTCGLTIGCQDRRVEAGPLKEPGDTKTVIGGLVGIGEVLAVGIFPMPNNDNSDVVLQSLTPLHGEKWSDVRLRYAVIRIDKRCGPVGALYGWPPHGCMYRLFRLPGFRYHPRDLIQLIVGATARRPGTWVIPAFLLRYKIGSTTYAAPYAQGMKIRVKKGYSALARIAK